MAIGFVPRRGLILLCHFDMARVPPEMRKTRRAVVISPRSHNGRHGQAAGRCIVVPFSATRPKKMTAELVHMPVGPYRSLTIETWAICSAVMAVSHDRLNRVIAGGHGLDETLTPSDMARLESGLRHALGIAGT